MPFELFFTAVLHLTSGNITRDLAGYFEFS